MIKYNKMASIEHDIDVAKYESKSNFFAHDQLEEAGDNNNYVENNQTLLDVEFIDYGICEEEEAVCEASTDQHPVRLELPQENSQGGPSGIALDMLSSCKNKRALVKVVDCEAFPWYYPKYKNQILKRKYQNAVEHARSIMKCLKDCLAEENATENVDEISDDENDSEKFQKAAIEKTIGIEKQVNHRKHEPKNERQKHFFTGIETQCTNSTFDIKKNTGLIGIKVQTIDTVKIKEKESTKNKNKHNIAKDDKSKKSKKLKYQNDVRYKTCNLNEPERENICLTRENSNTEKMNLVSTKVMNYLQDDKQPGTDRSISNLPVAGNTINEICNVVDSRDLKKAKKYKPMPKSKKSLLIQQQQSNQDKYDSNKNTNIMKRSKISRNDITAPKNNFPVTNQLTRKILKKLDNSLNNGDKNFTNKDKTTIQKTPNILGKSKELTMINNCNNEIRTNELSTSAVTSDSLEIKQHNTEYSISTSTVALNIIDRTFTQDQDHQDTDSKNNSRDNSIPSNMTSTMSGHRLNRLSTYLTNVSNKDSEEGKTFTSNLSNLVANQHHKMTAQSSTNKRKYNLCHDIQHHTEASIISTSPNDKSSSESQEYIVPDFINPLQIPCNTNKNISPPDLYTNNGIASSSHTPLFGSVQTTSQPINTVQNVRGEFINIAISHQPDRNANIIPINSKNPGTKGPHVPAVTDVIMRPNLLKPSPQANKSNCGLRFQHTSANMPVMPQYNMPPPNYARPPLLNVPPWIVNQYQNQNYRYPNPNFRYPPSTNVHRMPRNAFNLQPMFNNNFQNGYRQPLWFTSYNNMPHESPMPPGICNIAPNNDNYAFSQCPPSHTRMSKITPPPPPLPQCTNDDNSSIIGKNNNELIKKIKIQIPTVTKTESKNNEKQEIIKDMNANKILMANTSKLPVGSAASVATHTKLNHKKENNEIEKFLNNMPAITKSEMLKELEKDITIITDDKKGGYPKMPSRIDSQVNKQPQQTEPKLVKQFSLPKKSAIQTGYSKKQKQHLKRPLPALLTPELLKSHVVAHKPESTKHSSETLKTQKVQNLPEDVIEAIVRNIPLTEDQKIKVAESQATTLVINLGKSVCDDPRAKKLNNVGTYKPGPLSKRRKPADILTTPPRDSKKIPLGNGYSPPILPIPTFRNYLSDLGEYRDSCKATEDENLTSIAPENKSREEKKTQIVKSILRNKSIKTPEVPEKGQTKTISIAEYNKRNLKEQ